MQTHSEATAGSDDAYLRQTRSIDRHDSGWIQARQALKKKRREGGKQRRGDESDRQMKTS